VSVTSLERQGAPSLPPESSRARRRRERQTEDQGAVPLRLYGLRRGTVMALTALCGLFALFTLVPILWIVVNSTKTQENLLNSFGFWFARPFEFFHTFGMLFQNVDGEGVYFQWFLNTLFYAAVGGLGATLIATLAGYGFARFQFRGAKALFVFVVAALLVPLTAITYPLYLVYAKVGLINSVWGMICATLVTPVGVYLMRTFVNSYVPRELIDAARVDGAGELKIFFRVGLPLMVPGVMTVLLISVVGVWNNYFLPFIIFSKNNLFPLTVGLGVWATRAQNSGDQRVFPLIVMGGLVTIIPLVLLFLVVQRRWRGGLLLGSFAN
jgi:multiple sugar transport system permease protein